MHLDKEWRLVRHSQDPLFNHGAFDIVVLDDDVFFEYLDGIELVGTFTFSQHDFAKGSLAQDHEEVEVSGSNHVLPLHVVRNQWVLLGQPLLV